MLLQTTKNIPPLTILVGEIFELSPINWKGGSTAVYVQYLAPSYTYLTVNGAFDRNSRVASSRLVLFSDALNLSLGTSRTHHRATHKNLYSEFSSTLYRKRRGARMHSSSHTRVCFFSKWRMMTPGLCIWESHTHL